MNTLLIDNSNGRTKFALSIDGELQSDVHVTPTTELSTALRLPSDWHVEQGCLCSVVPETAELLRKHFKGICSWTEVSPNGQAIVDFSSYPGLPTLGADRVANCLAAASEVTSPTVVVDAGTAVTFDILLPGEPPRFVGGVISPGLNLLSQALDHGTAQLPRVSPTLPPHAIGSNTTAALQSGIVHGYIGSVKEILTRIAAELGSAPRCIATGGDAPLLAAHLREIERVDPLLTLRGIARYAENALTPAKKSH